MIGLRVRAAFTLSLLCFVAVLFLNTLRLGSVARFVPLIVLIPTLALLVLQLALDLRPDLEQKFSRFERIRFQKSEKLQKETLGRARRSASGVPHPAWAFLWMWLMLPLVYLLGFLVAVPLYTFLYLKGHAVKGWIPSIAIALALWALIYGIFGLLLNTQLYQGQIRGWLG